MADGGEVAYAHEPVRCLIPSQTEIGEFHIITKAVDYFEEKN